MISINFHLISMETALKFNGIHYYLTECQYFNGGQRDLVANRDSHQ
jgi:hypothetical protein